MTLAYLGLGSNMGDREAQIEAALKAIGVLPSTRVLRASPLYESAPWGPVEQPNYLNMVVEVETGLDPRALLEGCKEIERKQGRLDGERWGPRPIDIDILLYGDETLKFSGLKVPHPRMWARRFVLLPLADLRPDLAAPDGRPIEEILGDVHIAEQGVWRHDDPRKPEYGTRQS